MFIMKVLASQLCFLANRNAELAIPPLFWSVNCMKIEGLVALLSFPSIYLIFGALSKAVKLKNSLDVSLELSPLRGGLNSL